MPVAFNKLTILAKSYLILSCDAVCTHHVARINMHEQLQYYSSSVNEGLRLLYLYCMYFLPSHLMHTCS